MTITIVIIIKYFTRKQQSQNYLFMRVLKRARITVKGCDKPATFYIIRASPARNTRRFTFLLKRIYGFLVLSYYIVCMLFTVRIALNQEQ